ncbi:hypothetical protein ACL8ED_24655 [Pseudomonas aeruginosa]|uniref:hypothetical protein n=1 Tax=Pseudomonas aeruginosa TaxID=287 RepID=UPI003B671109
MSNIQIVDLPALPEVEEVCLSDIEDELLLSRHFCNFAWLFLARISHDRINKNG